MSTIVCRRICSVLQKELLRKRIILRCSYGTTAPSSNFFKSPHPELDLKVDSLPGYLFNKIDQYSSKTAIVDVANGKTYSFSQLKEYAIKIASGLRKLGYKKGDVIAVHATNCAEYAILLLAIPAAGLTITTTNPAFTSGEFSRCLDVTGASCVLTISALLPVVESAVNSSEKNQQSVKHIIAIDGDGFKRLMDDDGSAYPKDLQIDPENDISILAFSSGTTGLPKAVMLNHRSLVSNLQQLKYCLQTNPDDSFIAVLPFYHAYGMTVISFYAFQGGNKLVTLPKFDPEVFLQSIQDHKISFLHLVPPMAVFMAKHPMVGRYDLSAVQRSIIGAAPLGAGMQQEFIEKLNIQLFQGYGMTECGPGDVVDSVPPTLGTCGQPIPNTWCKFVHPETNELVKKIGDPGELCMKGPQLMKGYLNNPEATNSTIRDGWMYTGDIGYIREDGKMVITDRVKELIKYKAIQKHDSAIQNQNKILQEVLLYYDHAKKSTKIAPAELEDLLIKHPEVQDAAVVGIPEDRVGEVPRAYIVRKPNCSVTEKQLQKFVKDNAADFKQLRGGVEIVDAIPKTPSGKILRRQLKR